MKWVVVLGLLWLAICYFIFWPILQSIMAEWTW